MRLSLSSQRSLKSKRIKKADSKSGFPFSKFRVSHQSALQKRQKSQFNIAVELDEIDEESESEQSSMSMTETEEGPHQTGKVLGTNKSASARQS